MPAVAKRLPSGGEHGGYGWRPDTPDHRDVLFAADMRTVAKLAATPEFDLTGARQMPPVWDQEQLGSCTAHSVGAAFTFAYRKSGGRAFMPSRLWIYFQERVVEGSVNEDAGAEIRDGFKVINTLGVPPEKDWPYEIATFTQCPKGLKIGKDAAKRQALIYRRVPQSLNQIKAALLGGFPVSFGFSVYDSFESAEVARTGVVPMPSTAETLLGGHAVLAVGYSDSKQVFIVRNSWGTGWGMNGYFTMPYAYLTDPSLSSDFWTVTATETGKRGQ